MYILEVRARPCVCVVPATIVNSGMVDVVEVVENHTLYLTCPAEGVPRPSVLWLRDGVPLIGDEVSRSRKLRQLSSGRRLELRHVTLDDEAVYQCRAINVAGQQSKSFQLRVLGLHLVTPRAPHYYSHRLQAGT